MLDLVELEGCEDGGLTRLPPAGLCGLHCTHPPLFRGQPLGPRLAALESPPPTECYG